ncbi:MAG: hypothetical protein M3Q34_03840 [bacterium]|nr:hypothetical protein [bacterium]
MFLNLLKIFVPTTLAFALGILITPIATHFFYKYKMWKKKTRTESTINEHFKKIHENKANAEVSVPCVGGIIIFISIIFSVLIFYLLAVLLSGTVYGELFAKFNFFSRSQTIIPIGIFILGAFLGLLDDMLEIRGKSHVTRNSAWYTRGKIFAIVLLGLLASSWFFFKLDMHAIHIPFGGVLELGAFFIPFVIIVMLATFSGGVIDGIDGLSGGVLSSIFASYSVISFVNNQMDLAAFCGVVSGAILAFLWFNIPPARFYMGEVGMMPLTITLATIAFLTDSVLLLPVIAFPLVATSLSSIIQLLSKKFFKKKVFLVAPLHHHFEALGWPSYKVTMRYWVLSFVFAIIGVILVVIS